MCSLSWLFVLLVAALKGQEGCWAQYSAQVLVWPLEACWVLPCPCTSFGPCSSIQDCGSSPSMLLPQVSVSKRAPLAGAVTSRCSHLNCMKERCILSPCGYHGAGILLIVVKQIQYKSNKNDLDVDGFSSIVVLYQVMVFWGLCFSDNERVSFAKSKCFSHWNVKTGNIFGIPNLHTVFLWGHF